MVGLTDIIEIAGRVRGDGQSVLADALAQAHVGVFNGTELAMKWRHLLAQALEAELSQGTREQVQSLWTQLNRALA